MCKAKLLTTHLLVHKFLMQYQEHNIWHAHVLLVIQILLNYKSPLIIYFYCQTLERIKLTWESFCMMCVAEVWALQCTTATWTDRSPSKPCLSSSSFPQPSGPTTMNGCLLVLRSQGWNMARLRWTSGVRTTGREPCWLARSDMVRLSGTYMLGVYVYVGSPIKRLHVSIPRYRWERVREI